MRSIDDEDGERIGWIGVSIMFPMLKDELLTVSQNELANAGNIHGNTT